MEHSTYTGSVISNDATISNNLDNGLFKARYSFGRQSKRVWQSHRLRLSTKLEVYRAVIVPTLPYGAEAWVLYLKQIRLLERLHQYCLHSILGNEWQDHVSNEVLKRVSLPSTKTVLLQVQLRLASHITRMEDESMHKKGLQRSAEETACTGGNRPLVIAAAGLRPRQLTLIGETSQL